MEVPLSHGSVAGGGGSPCRPGEGGLRRRYRALRALGRGSMAVRPPRGAIRRSGRARRGRAGRVPFTPVRGAPDPCRRPRRSRAARAHAPDTDHVRPTKRFRTRGAPATPGRTRWKSALDALPPRSPARCRWAAPGGRHPAAGLQGDGHAHNERGQRRGPARQHVPGSHRLAARLRIGQHVHDHDPDQGHVQAHHPPRDRAPGRAGGGAARPSSGRDP
jgi:hypothetical protein